MDISSLQVCGSAEPGDGPYDDPTAGKDFGSLDLVGMLGDRNRPPAERLQGVLQRLASKGQDLVLLSCHPSLAATG